MADDTIALELEGSGFLLDDLDAIQHFRGLLRELAVEAAGGAAITWELRRFGTGSLVAEVQGIAEDQDAVHRVAAAYDCVGAALAVGDPVPYSDAVSAHADGLTSMIDGRVEFLRFRTGGRVREVRHASTTALGKPLPRLESFGAIEGVVETLARRPGTRFVVYPDGEVGGVSCYVTAENEARMPEFWGKRVRVEGLLRRDRETDMPLSIRDVTYIEIVKSPVEETEDLWGVLSAASRKPEEIMRAEWDGS